MGAVLDVVKRYVPASYSALVGSTNTYDYSSTDLQGLANFVQYRLYATYPGASNETTYYTDLRKLELAGILTTLQFIPAAVDYWGDQIASQSLSGTSENNSWFDRRAQLWELFDRLKGDAQDLAGEIGVITGAITLLPRISYGDNGRDILVTGDPELWPRAFRSATSSDFIPWSGWVN